MRRKLLVAAVCLSFPAVALGHLCNDVFVQARDNLAVKVDVRDGQLRIGKQASFRVYLLNTMDRGIANIKLEVRTDGKFDAEVEPSEEWKKAAGKKKFPRLECARRGGQKRHFEVKLKRKPGVPDGKYKIDLHLFNGKRSSMVFKTVGLGQAAGICELPPAAAVKVDGSASPAEWGKSFLCSDFYAYKKGDASWRGKTYKNKFEVKSPAADVSRFRVTADKDNLYLCLGFQGGAGAQSDVAALYVAKALDSAPVKFSVDRLSGKVTCAAGTTGVECKVGAGKDLVEVKVPRKLLGVDGVKSFYANFTRTTTSGGKELVTYWRATKYSVDNPIEYAQFKVAE